MRIDAHQHFWQRSLPFDYRWLDAPNLAPIRRDFLPGDLKAHLDATGVERSIFVQTQHNVEENRWALGLAERNAFLIGVVGWVDLASDDCERQLLEFKAHPKFVGVRHVVQDEPDDDFILRPDVLRGLAVLERHEVPFDLLFNVKHLRHASTLARRFPNLKMVIDHLAKPRIKDGATDDWLPHFREAAMFPNVYCKLSGMVTEADWRNWKTADLRPYVDTALDAFGPERCMFGSDWPVCELASTYERVVATMDELLANLSDSDRRWIYADTAKTFYKLTLGWITP
jgi:L-fuconolactonase